MHLAVNREESRLALVADVGRSAVRLGLTDHAGRLRPETVRSFTPEQQSTISGALETFGRQCELPTLPSRCAIAVSGAPVGDTISVTNSRWYVSRSGLRAMLQAEPLILNDFAANAWAVSTPGCGARIEPVVGEPVRPQEPGTRCLIGIGSGLGVAVVARDAQRRLTVIPTEAGHCHFIGHMPELDPILDMLRRRKPSISAEDLISARGLLAIYRGVAEASGSIVRATDARAVVQLAAAGQDTAAVQATELFARALWYFAGNMSLAYGAWDGVMVTGSLASALRNVIRLKDPLGGFLLEGPYRRELERLPRSLVTLEHAELHGAAQALLQAD